MVMQVLKNEVDVTRRTQVLLSADYWGYPEFIIDLNGAGYTYRPNRPEGHGEAPGLFVHNRCETLTEQRRNAIIALCAPFKERYNALGRSMNPSLFRDWQ